MGQIVGERAVVTSRENLRRYFGAGRRITPRRGNEILNTSLVSTPGAVGREGRVPSVCLSTCIYACVRAYVCVCVCAFARDGERNARNAL